MYKLLICVLVVLNCAAAEARHNRNYTGSDSSVVGHNTSVGCPSSKACGCVASVRVFGHPVRELFLASNWSRFPSASPAPGNVAWRHGHVFVLDHQDGEGRWIVYDGNSGGHMIRLHARPLAGYHIVSPH